MTLEIQKLKKELEILIEMMNNSRTEKERDYYQIKAYQLDKFIEQMIGWYNPEGGGQSAQKN